MDTTCIGNRQQQQKQQIVYHHAEYNLLFDTLKNIWHNYFQAFNNADVKQHWLQLFLFNFQFVSEELMENEEFQSFFNPIPEELCSYLLEQIYEIISKSDLYIPSLEASEASFDINKKTDDTGKQETTEKNNKFLQLLKKNHNFAQLILKQPSDCSKIIALRQFLTHQLGQHLLEFLLKVDIKLVASQKSLCNLCINLFPNCPWSETYCELSNQQDIFTFIGDLQFYQKFKCKTNTNVTVTKKEVESLLSRGLISASLEDFTKIKKTSDEIALLLIKILIKCIENEHFSPLHTDQSMFMLTLNFSLDCLSVENQVFSSLHNAEVIKCYLLKLNEQCLNSMFSLAENSLNDIQFQCIFAKLIAALECNMQSNRLLYALIYIIFAILHNVVAIYSQKTLWNAKVNLYNLKFIDENIIDCCLSTMEHLLRHQAQEQEDIKSLYHLIFRTLLKIIENLNKYDMMISTISNNYHFNTSSHLSTSKPAPLRYRKMKTKQQHCLSNVPKLSCYFQNILVTILPSLSKDLQEQSMAYLARFGLCCCHYNLALIKTILNIIYNLTAYYQKCAYKFIYYKMLNTIFLKLPLDNTNNIQAGMFHKRSGIFNCAKCDMKLKSLDFHQGLLQIYKTFYNKLQNIYESLTNLIYFLKHLKHLSFLLTNDIATGILAEIVLPIFRRYKLLLFSQKSPQSSPQHGLKFWQKSPLTETPENNSNFNVIISQSNNTISDISKLLYECLNIFTMYLRDVRLIKAFYNEENIKHLEDLLEEPFLIRAVCDLIKIGIDNITFLGDNNQEQNILSRRLITLQFNSSERAQLLFNSLLIKAKNINKSTSETHFWLLENSASSTSMKPNTLQLQTVDILHIVALQWTLNYELLKTSQYFYNEFAKIYSINKEDDDEEMHDEIESDLQSNNSTNNKKMSLKPGDKTIIDILQLNYNALTAFLMLPPKRKVKANKYSDKSKQRICQKSNDKNSYGFQEQQQSTANNEFDSGWEILENFINSIHSLETTSLSSNTSSSTKTTFSLHSHEVGETTLDLTEFPHKHQQSIRQSSFLLQMHQKDTLQLEKSSLNESITIFDIRNQKHLHNRFKNIDGLVLEANTATNSPSSTTLYVDTFNYCSADDPKTVTANIATQVSNEGIINKLFSIFGSIFYLSRSNSLIGLNKSSAIAKEEEEDEEGEKEPDINADLLPLYEAHSDCKKLLLKIFEATMAICIKGYQNEKVEKMQKHLRKLKSVILTNASNNWEQYAEEHSRENTVIQTLQCLLKIAELSNCANEPAAVVSASILTSATEDQAILSEIRSRTRSFNISRIGGGISYNYHQLPTVIPKKNAVATPTTPPQRPLSGNSYDADYFSTRASYMCADSELEFSENEQEDFYLTADEGYEADAEIQEISETEVVSEAAELWHSFQPSSRYRTHILHNGICRLVVDILIELSQKCIKNPLVWCDNLAQLINRLFVIREYLGGPLFLLKGFSPVLKCHDVRLRELQQCILELIVDLNTPEVLSIFFGILSSKNPPVDILVKYMNYICTNTLKKCQPSKELEFPVNIGNSYDVDYFSTRASYMCADSELEFSENEQEDFYLTADEGYEADAEIQEISETEFVSEAAELWHSFQPSSRYRTHILHNGICRLEVDILIELSQKCIKNPLVWCDNLAQLINRLFVIREYLGGPLFLLKGFAPVLKCHDVRLRELQQCILELIANLNTPEVLKFLLTIYLICNRFLEIKLLNSMDGNCVSTSDPDVTEHIDRMRNYHLHCQANTPFTKAPCIIPITHTRLWNPEGLTVSLWLQAKGSQNHRSTSQIIEDDTRSSSDVYMKSHILSVGTNQAMLSVYLNNNLNLTFETFKPNAEIPIKTTTPMDEPFEAKQNVIINGTQNHENKINKRSHHHNHNQEPTATTSGAVSGVKSPFSKAFKHTKLAFLSSISNMHLFNGHSESDAYFESTHLDLKQFRLTKNKWTHLTFAIEMQTDTLDLCIFIDGLEKYNMVLPFRNIHLLTRNHVFQMIAIGDGNVSKSPNTTTSFTESRSTLDSFPMRLSISNIMLFNRAIKKEETLNLTAMGPDFTELTQCHVANWKPNYGYLNTNKLQTAYFSNHVDSLKTLRDSRILCYSASQPDIVMCYDTVVELDNIIYGHPYGVIHYGELVQNSLQSLQSAIILCGGLSNLLYLFARVVELSSNSTTQSMALDILLNVAISESQLYTEFQRNDYINLIGYVIKTEKCSKDCHLLKSIINNACSQPLILKKGDLLQVNDTTIAAVVYPKLLIFILHRYSDWHRSGAENSDVLDVLLQSILALTREKHPQRDFNIEQFIKEGLMRELLNLCKVYVIESPNPVYISKKAAKAFVNIISIFAGSPPKPCLLDEIMKLLLLLHKPSECYITHDRSKFYFLLTSEIPIKEKSSLTAASNFGRVTASFKRTSTKFNQPREAKPLLNDLNTNSNSNSSSDVDVSRQARLNRLRKLHKTVSTYKRPIEEFEENLENMADCTKLNKPALHLVNPLEASKWRLKFRKRSILATSTTFIKHTHSPYKSRALTKMSAFLKQSPQNKRIHRKRIRLSSTNSSRSLVLTDGEKPMRQGPRKSETSLYSLATSINKDFSECTVFNEVFASKAYLERRKSKTLHKTDTYSSVGIAALQSGLLLLLKDFLCLLPDNDIDDVLNHYIKVEFLLVLANHNNTSVRSAVIKLISSLTQRLFPQDLQVCIKALYPHHLANQLSIGFCDINMFESCLEWVCGTIGSLDTILNCDINLRIQNRFGLNALLAIASKPTASSNIQQDFSEKAFKVLKQLYLGDPDEQQTMIEAGLVQCCIKALYHLYDKTTSYNRKTEESIADLLTTIGEKSLKSIGHINILWDVINMLSFYQENQPHNVIKGYRSIQAKVQLNWLNMFFIKTNVPWSFKVYQFPNLSMSETKTRLELLINRCCQFYMIFDEKSSPNQNETELFKMLVSYSIATNQRCNNFIAWGLQPSQPRDLRCFIVDALWISCDDDFMPSIICDGKMIKALLWLSLLEDLDEPIKHLQALCKRLGINENDSTWNLENELQRMDLHKCSEAAKQKTSLEKTIYRFEALTQGCIESSMITTRRVAELQNSERKLLMNHMKDYDDTQTYTKWLEIVRRLTHEGAPWFSEHNREKSWELDDTEGPSRVHTRLRSCHLDLDQRFFMKHYNESNSGSDFGNSTTTKRSEYSRPLDYLISSYDQQLNISLNSQILYNFPAKYLPVDGEIDGEIIVTDHKLYFLATYRCKYFYVNCDISNITEIWLKRYQHQEKAFEIFLDTNQSLFFSLQNQEDWKIMRDVFCDKIVTPPDQSKVLLITQQWREGLLTNWEYIMTLNQIAGRTYNDLMQYPVFPWILSNYSIDILDLLEPKNFRKLSKPIAVQNEENEHHYINNYTYIKNTMTNMGSMILKPYHYSSHYSNSGTVLHFLVRVPPFTSYFLRYQDNNFDIPDRTFHALSTTYCLASRDSPTDVKELIPEFFCLPEMFENFERFNFGCRQNGERVEDVALPPWCLKDPRLFILIHRQALESELVRSDLHYWIDLIFGFKQTGEAAVEAINVFHPATYAVFLESEINDPIEREAVETMVKTYGQMPRQLFKSPHPSSKPLQYHNDKQILSTVRGLRWGIYVGSPQLPEPTLGNTHKLLGAEYLLSFNNTNVVYGLPARSYVMQGAETDTYNVISWGYDDRIVRIQPLNKLNAKPKNLLYNSTFDDITACGCDANSNQLWFGHKSGRLSIYKCSSVEVNQRTGKSRQSYVKGLKLSYNSAFRKITSKAIDSDGDLTSSTISSNSLNLAESVVHKEGTDLSWSGPTVLIRHTDEITCIALSVDFKIAVTAGKDGIAVIWDLNNWTYVRTIERPAEIHHSPITLLSISPTLGDIVTVHSLTQQPSTPLSHSDYNMQEKQNYLSTSAPPPPLADECFEVTEENLDDFVNVSINPNGKSILRLHSVNARYVQHNVHEDRIMAVCYSYIKEGVGVNVIATAVEGGIVRLWSSWNLSFITEIVTGLSNIRSITYSTHQHLVVLTEQAHIQVWETKGLSGNSPKFPQIAYK